MPDYEKEMPKLIRKATRHAQEVAGREHIKADRHERVGHFVTTLRRLIDHQGLGPSKNGLINGLCRKEIWHDAGELSEGATFSQPLELWKVKSWVAGAKALFVTPEETALDSMDAAIAEANEHIEEMRPLINQAEVLAEEGQTAADELQKLVLA